MNDETTEQVVEALDSYNPFKSRKFLLALGVITFACCMFALGKMTESGWITSVTLGYGIYGVANVSQKIGA